MTIPLTREPETVPGWMGLEHCCFCAARTPLWYAPKDVAVCAPCGAAREPDEVPTKAQWCASRQAKGVV